MATVPAAPRSTTITLASPSAGPFNVGFRLFDANALDVYVNGVKSTNWTLNATFANGFTDTATITFLSTLASGTQIVIDAALVPLRGEDYAPTAPLVGPLNIEQARLWSAIADVRQLARRAVRGLQEIEPAANIDLVKLASAESFAIAADASKVAAAGSATAAAGSASAAAASAASINLPSIVGKALNFLRVNAGATGYEHRTPAQALADLHTAVNIPANTLRGNPTGSAAAEADVTMTQLRSMLGVTTTGNSLITAGDAAIARTAIAAPPTPNAAGYPWYRLYTGPNANLTLPAGGIWAWFFVRRNASTGGVVEVDAGTSPGGTTRLATGSNEDCNTLVWRIA